MNTPSPSLKRRAVRPLACCHALLWAFSLGLALYFTPAVATAKQEEPRRFSVTIMAYKVDETGRRAGRFLPSEQPKTGDFIIYRASYRNLTKEVVPKVVINIRVPDGMVYIADSTRPTASRASQDGGNYFSIKTSPPAPPLSTWRSVQWDPRDLAPLSELVAELKVRVVSPSVE